jgi:hypothetical protein
MDQDKDGHRRGLRQRQRENVGRTKQSDSGDSSTLQNRPRLLPRNPRSKEKEMTDDPEQCVNCFSWEAPRDFDGICAGHCRKLDKITDSDELACEHYEEFKEE